jgi:outer membrane lipoprotein-sorting protein
MQSDSLIRERIRRYILKLISKILIIVLFAGLFVIGCSQQATPVQNNEALTSVASTVVAMQTQIANASASNSVSVQPTAELATLEPTPAPTATTAPTPEPTAAPTTEVTEAVVPTTSSQTASGPSYRVGNVQDLNYPDGTYMNATMYFTKIWKITNVGTGTWAADTKVVPVEGNLLQAGSYTIGQVVSPGQSVTIRLALRAPETIAKYRGKFMLQLSDGTLFGVGANFDQPFWVEIYTH